PAPERGVKRRLLVSNLVLVTTVLLLLELPLAVIYSRHEHDALDSALQRDATSLASLSEEVIEHPGDHDVGGLAQRFTSGAGGIVAIYDRNGRSLSDEPTAVDPRFDAVLLAARNGHTTSGETAGLAFVAVPVGGGATHGAVFVARSAADVEHRTNLFWLALLGIGAGVLLV